MFITDYFIHKPVVSITLCCMLFLAGCVALCYLPVRLMPRIDIPIVDISTNYSGATAKMVQETITAPLQTSLTGIDGIDYIASSSSLGKSDIQVHFKIGNDLDVALNRIIYRITSEKQNLPIGIDDPVIKKLSADDKPVSIIAFTSKNHSRLQVADYLQTIVKPQLEMIHGIASADVMGDRYAMRVWLDPVRLVENGLNPLDVALKIKNQHVVTAIGVKKYQDLQFNLNANTQLNQADQFNQIIVKNINHNLLRLSDIGSARLGSDTGDIEAIFNGSPVTMVFVTLLPDANPFSVMKKINNTLSSFKKLLPQDLNQQIIFDASRYIHLSFDELLKTTMITMLIVIAVIFLFLGNLRATLIPVITIPLSLISTCIFLWFGNCSLNVLTLLAAVLAMGLVVDDAIIILENSCRYIERGFSSYQAALIGAREVISPIVCMSVILAIVYIPLIFIGGLTGKFFTEFALMLSISIVISAVVSLILSPLMCSKLLSHNLTAIRLTKTIEKNMSKLLHTYRLVLQIVIQHGKLMSAGSIVLILASIVLYLEIPKELAPREDQGFLQVIGNAPDSTNANYLTHYTNQLNKLYQSSSDIERYIYINNIPEQHQFLSFVTLRPAEKRTKSISALHKELQNHLNDIAGIEATVIEPSALPIDSGLPIRFVLKTTMDYKTLYQLSEKIKLSALQSGKFMFIDQDVHFDMPEYTLNINRDIAANMGINIDDITRDLSLLFGEYKLQEFNMAGQNYPIILHVSDEKNNLLQISIKNQLGEMVPMSTLLSIKKTITFNSINQFQKINSITLTGVMSKEHTLGEGLQYLENQVNQLHSSMIDIDYSGESRLFYQENRNNLIVFCSAILLVYFVLAILFNHFYQPLIVLMGSLPGTFFSALLSLYFTHTTINIYTEIGMITLIGLVSKHGILMVQFANQSKDINRTSAIIEASITRFRPIMMTTVAMILAAIPLVMATGAGSQSRFSLGIVIVAGVLFGTVFTLLMVPFFYSLIQK